MPRKEEGWLSRAWGFVKRHKYKFIIGGALVGGAYVIRKFWIKTTELHKLLANNISNAELLQQLTLGRSREWKMNLHFQRNQHVADDTVKKGLVRVRANLFKLFCIDQVTVKLREQSNRLSPEEKAALFDQIKIECVSRTLASVYVLHLLLLLHRLEINIIGRQMFSEEDGKPHEQNYAFLSSTRYIQEEGLGPLVEVINTAVQRHLQRLSPQDSTNLEELTGIMREICQEIDTQIVGEGRAVDFVCPEHVAVDDKNLSEEGKETVKQLLGETRDYLESPQFSAVLRLSIDNAWKKLGELLKEKFAPDIQFPLARSFGRLCQLAENVLASNFSNAFIEDFAATPAVTELSEMVYYPPDLNRENIPKTPSIAQLLDRMNLHGTL
uniref:Peroxisome biogenesis factor 3 n=2 Tax=Chromera velia TaxID=505693 RepID=A0A2K8DN94_9ALVE|nr:Peroxisome biogenesis factor 3 [Chromera velia]|mmetsp:Transcript_38575/g.75744  ORF Transcript_38575/g.75744 Transcript_38575/m.75744 type:complete len:383 (-) Transcript_38575:252-1400(-)|eukprot:Cvel_4686.t1-p1 / transcript=Cvel_4686.t1 / gene=Cvel_4686 / organism=Chromera_velia_CCMP2878 / gene_product=Peroxisomal biogenesis factor 3, putative / transcript_product=Peroxisomal biogenesis factor 3, putative / location=Cvel_scaffold208:1091-8226(-) / protein_length=382 / sequence_SO=supercontig / SO=protein_coding / is_pseudo=false